MVKFNYARVRSMVEAVELLNEPGLTSRPEAGGTDLMVYLRQKTPWFDRLINISRITELKLIEQQDGQIKVGGGVTFTRSAQSDLLRQVAPLLVQPARVWGAYRFAIWVHWTAMRSISHGC